MDAIKNLIPQMVEEWEDMQNAYYPDRQGLYGFMTTVIPRLTGVEKVLDLCTGAGSLARQIMTRIPGTTVTGVDFDDIMLEMARYNLRDHGDSFRAEKRNLWDRNWYEGLSGDYDVVVSAYALHTLKEDRKKEIFSDVSGLLKEGGVFICLDEIRSVFCEFDHICAKAMETVRDQASMREQAKDWRDFWNRVGERIGRKNYADELLSHTYPEGLNTMGSLYHQLKMLKSSGFGEVECFYRDLSIVIFGGMKE